MSAVSGLKPGDEINVTGKARTATSCLVIYVVGTVLLCSAAIYNGYPLVYFDSGSYLRAFIELHNLPDRPVLYSIFLGLLHWRFSLWPVVIAQSALTVFVIERTIAYAIPRAPAAFTLGGLLLLTLTTSLPWFTGQIMPFMFAPLIVLLFYLLIVERDRLPRWEYLAFLLILCFSQGIHYTHIALTLGLIVFGGLIWLVFRAFPVRNLVPVALGTLIASASIYAVNFAERRDIVFGPYNSILLFDRLLEYRTAQDYLVRTCPEKHYEVCAHLDELKALPATFGGFMWNDAGVLPKVGGPEHYRFEAAQLTHDIILDSPLKHLWLALGATGWTMFNFPTGEEFATMGEGFQIYRIIDLYFHRELDAYLHSREYTGAIDFKLINAVDVPVGYFSLVAIIALLFVAGAKRDVNLTILVSMVIATLVGNAFICGGLSSGDSHYQSRMIPLVLLVVAIGAFRVWFDKTRDKAAA
jgi:hypothetical protein